MWFGLESVIIHNAEFNKKFKVVVLVFLRCVLDGVDIVLFP